MKPPSEVQPARGYLDPLFYRDAMLGSLASLREREIVQMLSAVASGSQMGPGDGWFHPGQGRYDWKWLAARHDINGDGRITLKEFKGPRELFDRLDRDRDGVITRDDLDWSERSPYVRMSGMIGGWFNRIDTSSNGRISRDEWEEFFKRAGRGKEHLTTEDLRDALLQAPPKPKDAPKESGPSPAVLFTGLLHGELGSFFEGPAVGDRAPNFTLQTHDSKRTIALKDYRGKKPVVLIFGSFTWGPYRSQFGVLDDLYTRYRDRVEFLAVYVREAHPIEGWRMASNDRAGVVVKQPKTKAERVKVAHHCCTALQMSMPVLVDEIDDRVGHAYSGMPDRLFVIDRDGRVAYKGGRGPFGFKPGEMEQSLVLTLLDQAERPSRPTSRLPLLRDEEAWKLLPAAGKDVGKPLPAWAKTLARPLPATTAAMLRLDYLHRAASPFDAKLRGKMRWVAARANHCAYAEAYALADLRRAGVQENELKALAGDPSGWSAAERDALLFARKLTRSAHLVSDDEMAGLIKRHGEKQVVAMVLLLAYANFQDRLLLTLGLTAEPGGPLAPLDVRPSSKGQASVPAREMPPPVNTPLEDLKDPEWAEFEFSALQLRVDRQRERSGRIRVPSWEEVSRHLPAAPPRKPLKIKWSLVCMGYQPELAAAWSACTSSFGREARQDRVFEESLFWVVTRSLQCFYWMGHCEMLLAVAGLDEKALVERTRRLAGDWSSFPASERAAYVFARKQAKSPWDVSAQDVECLVNHFGPERAIDVIWWACRCHYMTRVADAFQLPLEKENVFEGLFTSPKKPTGR